MRKITHLATVAALVSAGTLEAQPVTTLRAGARLAREFSDIGSVQELPNGEVLVTDRQERVILLVDWNSGRFSSVSREGSGPLEYRTPGRFFRWAGDSVAMYDPGQTRVLVFDPSGSPRRSMDLVSTMSWIADGHRPSRGDIRFIDAQGRIYVQSSVIPQVPVGQTPPDSGPIVRYDIPKQRVDTISLVRLSNLVYRPNAGVRFGDLANPFRVQDAWTAFADGRVAIVRSEPYAAEWIDVTGRRTRGPSVPSQSVPVTQADREALAGEGVVIGGRPTRVPLEQLNNLPAVKPTFDSRTVIADPTTSSVWVQRFRHVRDTVPVYDVFGSTGRLTNRVRVPSRARVVGFGRGSVYLARKDADGLERLERAPRP